MPGVRRVDAHHHVWDLAVRDQPWTANLPRLRRSFDLCELRPQLAAHDVDATVVVQTVTVPEETPELLALATEPPVAGVVGWVDLTTPDVAERLAELHDMRGGRALVGIRHQVQEEADPRWLCRPDVRRGLEALAEADLLYDLVVVPHQLPAAIETARDLPGLRFILDHAGKPAIAEGALEPWRGNIRALAALPNVAVKMSGLLTEAGPSAWTSDHLRPYVDVLIESFGAQRMMFGSDWPVCLLASSYGQVVEVAEEILAGLDPAQQARVFGGTATEWYRLEGR